MKAIDQHNLEVLITLSLVMVTYAVATELHLSGPLAVVVAGLFIGNHGKRFAMSASTRHHIDTFWSLLDEVLNSLLFLAIGFEVVAIAITGQVVGVALLAIPVVLLARWVSVAAPITLLGLRQTFTKGAIPVLTWGGLRGGISVALALALPASPYKPVLLATTYGVVIFSIVVQGIDGGKARSDRGAIRAGESLAHARLGVRLDRYSRIPGIAGICISSYSAGASNVSPGSGPVSTLASVMTPPPSSVDTIRTTRPSGSPCASASLRNRRNCCGPPPPPPIMGFRSMLVASAARAESSKRPISVSVVNHSAPS